MSSYRTASQAVYVISVAARLCGAHPQTLRAYEAAGLLAPLRSNGGVRLYSDEDVALLGRILELTAQGVNLVGVQRIIALEAEVTRLRALLADESRRQSASSSQDVSSPEK